MSGIIPILKKPKVEQGEEVSGGGGRGGGGEVDDEETTVEEQESAFVALIEHRTREVEHLRKRIDYYTSKANSVQLAFPVHSLFSSSLHSFTILGTVNRKVSQHLKLGGSGMRDCVRSSAQTSSSTQSDIIRKVNAEKPDQSHSDVEVVENQDKGRKKKHGGGLKI
ncbi:unnamed protein product [Linum tenue]|uniref:Uncharacterized protein n=1 Tax=Linum tenue TaxID=586396 RepID=A0AAV0MMH8_9ROSI|nr:unnamed protein product [Linum tenue]